MTTEFASEALRELSKRSHRKIMVSELFQSRSGFLPGITVTFGWRFWVYQRASTRIVIFCIFAATYCAPVATWLTIRGELYGRTVGFIVATYASAVVIWIIARYVSEKLGSRGILGSNTSMRLALLILMQSKTRAQIFWYLHFVTTYSLDTFLIDYREAWRIQAESDGELIMFVDNDYPLVIPCSKDTDDEELLRRLRCFYELTLARGGITMLLGLKASSKIEIVDLENGHAIRGPTDKPLNLGRHGAYNRQVHYFKNPSLLKGHDIRDRLIQESVLIGLDTQQAHANQQAASATPSQAIHNQPISTTIQQQGSSANQGRRALNVVRTWNPQSATVIVLFPFVSGTLISILWPIVATIKYKADVKDSVQTGFTIGSFVVTAGALLVALVAFLDSKTSR